MTALCLIVATTTRADTVITNIDATTLSEALTNGGVITFGASGTITATQPLEITQSTIIDASSNTVTITGGGTNRIFNIHTNSTGTNITVTLMNLTITAGSSTNGAGIYSGIGCSLVLVSNTFSGHHATNSTGRNGSNGGGSGGSGASGTSGGSASGAAIYSLGSLVVSNCSFTGNSATAGLGGNGGNGQSGFIFGGNGGNGGSGGAASGGAIYCSGNSSIYNSSFSQNLCNSGGAGTGGTGGSGPFAGNPGSSGSGGVAAGGAIYAAGPIGVTNCLFKDNHTTGGDPGGSGLGGGVYVSSAPAAEGSLENCTFFVNSTVSGVGGLSGGGGIASARISSLRNCTLAVNDVFGSTNGASGTILGGNIYCQSGTFTVLNTILAASTNSASCAGTLTDGGYNICSDSSARFTVTTSHNSLNPLLDSTVKTNGGPTLTLALLSGSPAIDQIPTNFSSLVPATDQRGISRPQPTNGLADIGAFEFLPVYTITGTIRSGNLRVTNATITVTTPTNEIVLVTNVTGTNTSVQSNIITLITNAVITLETNGIFSIANLPANTYLITPFITNGTISPSNLSVSLGGSEGPTNITFEVVAALTAPAYADLYNFPTNSGPRGNLMIGSDGTIYGTTYSGGLSNAGQLFSISSSGAGFASLHSFDGTNGANPYSGAIFGLDGNFYGTTYAGGASNLGTVYRLRNNGQGSFTNLVTFVGANGAQPYAGLIQSTNDTNFYGTTSAGGDNGRGTIFKMSPDGALANLYPFTGGSDGGTPLATLVAGTNGSFYGTTFFGGVVGLGTVFNITTNGTFTSLHSFTGLVGGAYPAAPLVLGRDGFFYGTTTAGGVSNAGSIFKIGPDGAFTSLIDITDPTVTLTNAPLVQGSDGTFYGTAYSGGASNLGFTFHISTSNTLEVIDFTGTNGVVAGGHPYAGQTLFTNGIFYGVTSDGGVNNGGVLYRIGQAPTVTTQPTNVTVSPTNLVHSSAIFSVKVQGSTPLAYYWLKNSTNLVKSAHLLGVTNASLTIPNNIVAADVGTYSCIVSNAFGFVESTGAQLIIANPPKITIQPVSLLRQPVGSDVNFKVTVTGAPTLIYQWYKNGGILTDTTNFPSSIIGSTTTNLTIQGITNADVGSYYVIITNTFSAVTSSSVVLTTNSDTTTPTVIITSPTLNVRTDYPFLIGTASDNVRVSKVSYWVTNTQFATSITTNDATLDNGVKTRSWIIVQQLDPGTNILSVQATDFSGNKSTVVSRTFFYKVPAMLTLSNHNNGGGHFTGTASIAGDPVPGPGVTLNIGERYTITAVTDTNSYFSNWFSSTATNYSPTNPTITFVMQSNTSFTVNFVTNLFIGMAGVYNGLFYQNSPSNDLTDATLETSGMISGFKTSGKGVYSGQLLMNGTAFTLAGSFNQSGASSNAIARAAAQGGRMIVLLTNLWNETTRQIQGTVTGTNLGGWISSVGLVTAPTNATTNSIEYTMIIPPTTNPPNQYPGGSGYALITNKANTLIFTVKLPDATAPFTQTVPLSETKFAPIYASLDNNTGALFGWLDFGANHDIFIPVGTLAWIKKSSRASLFYTNGFTNLIPVSGSIWTNSGRGIAALPFTTNIPGTLEISGGDLSTSLTYQVSFTTNNVLTKVSGPTNSLAGTIDPKTGLVTVTFGNGNGKTTTTATGAALQYNTTAAGAFLGKTNSGSISLHP